MLKYSKAFVCVAIAFAVGYLAPHDKAIESAAASAPKAAVNPDSLAEKREPASVIAPAESVIEPNREDESFNQVFTITTSGEFPPVTLPKNFKIARLQSVYEKYVRGYRQHYVTPEVKTLFDVDNSSQLFHKTYDALTAMNAQGNRWQGGGHVRFENKYLFFAVGLDLSHLAIQQGYDIGCFRIAIHMQMPSGQEADVNKELCDESYALKGEASSILIPLYDSYLFNDSFAYARIPLPGNETSGFEVLDSETNQWSTSENFNWEQTDEASGNPADAMERGAMERGTLEK